MSRKAPTPDPAPAATPAPLPMPSTGGCYIRDGAGNLIAVDEDGQPLPTADTSPSTEDVPVPHATPEN